MLGKRPGPEDKFWKWLEIPVKDLPLEEVRPFVQRYNNLFRELDLASRCDRCDWQFRERIKTDSFGFLLPDIQELRELANLLRLRSSLEIADGRYSDAVQTLRVGFAMAKHANESPTLIAALVGVAVANQMADQVVELIQVSGAPNLYWAVTDLPRPFIDLRLAAQSERMMVYGLLSPLTEAGLDIRTIPLSTQQLQERLEKFFGSPPYDRTEFRLYLIAVTAKTYPEAKRFLLSQGLAPETVEAMPRLQVVFLFALAEYNRLFDEMIKWQGIPYWQMRAGLEKADRGVREDRKKAAELERLPLASYLIPAVQKVFFTTTRIDRKLAALRSIEAIRLYVAGHEGKLPSALSDITDVPIPIDPVTGKEFDYRMDDAKAILSAPPPAGEPARSDNYLKYELTLAK
jgi:hypothetical protein